MCQLDAHHEPALPHFSHVGQRGNLLLEPVPEQGNLGLQGLKGPVTLEDVQRSACRCTRQGIARVAMPVEECLVLSVLPEESLMNLLGDKRCSQGQVPAREPLRDGHHIGSDLFVLAREHPSGPAEPGGNFIADEQYIMLPTQLLETLEKTVRMHDYSCGSLHPRLHHNCRYLASPVPEKGSK